MKLLSFDFLVRIVAATAAAFSIAAIAGGFNEANAATVVSDCRHDTAPVNTGRYADDKLKDEIVTEKPVAVGTILTMNYLVAGKIYFIECKTVKARIAVLALNGDVYDKECGNLIFKGVEFDRQSSPAPAQAASAPTVVTCSGELQLDGSCIERRRQIVIVETVPMRQCQGDSERYTIDHECRFQVGQTVFVPGPTTVACPTCAKATVGNFTSTTDGRCQAVIYNGKERHTVAFGRVRREAPDSRYVLTVHSVDGREVLQAKRAILLGQVSGSYAYVDGGTDACSASVTKAVISNWPDVLTAAGLPSSCTMMSP